MKLLASIALAVGLLGAIASAQAMPISPLSGSTNIATEVSWRCGPGRHLNRFGHCVRHRTVCRIKRVHTRNKWGRPIVKHVRVCR